MKILFATVILILHILHIQGQNKFAQCDRSAWKKIGCFNDAIKPTRPLPEMLLNDRDPGSKYREPGYLLNWQKWRESLHSLACRCAEKARMKGYSYFGLQFYGECWSGPLTPDDRTYARDGASKRCIMDLTSPTDCVKDDPKECVGLSNTNYIYQLTDNPGPQSPDVDGNYTNWSEWTKCSKSCGGGSKSRERTCTNPKPEGNGLPCSPRLGEPEEEVKCNEKPCDECDKVMDVGIVIDSSSSVRRDNYERIKQFLADFVDKFPVSHRMTHVGIVHYNHRAYLDWDFSDNRAQNRAALVQAITDLPYQPGGTRTDRALELSIERMFNAGGGERPNVPHVLLVITDGKTSSKSEAYSKVLKPFKDEGVKIIAIGVGALVDEPELKQIAMSNEKNVLRVASFGSLLTRIKDIIKLSCAARSG